MGTGVGQWVCTPPLKPKITQQIPLGVQPKVKDPGGKFLNPHWTPFLPALKPVPTYNGNGLYA